MKYSSILWSGGLIFIVVILYFSVSSGPSDEEYRAGLNTERLEKDDFMKSDKASPFREGGKTIAPLSYFEPDVRYRIVAELEPVKEKKVVILSTSTGDQTRYLEYAWASFELDGVQNKLLILEIMDMGPQRGKLFLAFADATSANETYGGGRYLDIKKIPAASSVELDFNKAYNPYCAYNDAYSCPLPPRENLLKIAVRAGEMSYHVTR